MSGKARLWLRRAGFGLAGIAGLLLLLAAAAAAGWGWIHTEGGKRALAGLIARAASGPGFQLTVGDLEGEVPFRMRLKNLAVADHKGRWLAIRSTTVALDPYALFQGRLEIGEIAVDRLEMTRPPLPDPEPAGASPAAAPPPPAAKPASRKPGRGLAVAIRRLVFNEVALGGTMPGGEAALLRAEGTAEVGDPSGASRVDLRFGRRDGLPGVGHLHVSYQPETDRLEVDLAGSEPEGGLVARGLGLPGLPALAFNAIGVAPLADWRGRITLAADGRSVLDLEMAARRVHGGFRIGLTGGARPGGLLPAPWAGLAGPSPSLALELMADDEGGLTLKPGSNLALAAGTVALEGMLEPDSNRLSLRARTEPTPETLAAIATLPKDSNWKRAVLEAGFETSPAASGILFDLKAEVDYLTGADPLITRLAGPHFQGAAHGMALRSGEVRLDGVELALAAGKLRGAGSGRPGEGRFSGSFHLAADHLNRLLGAFGVPVDGVADLDLGLEAADGGARLEVSGTTASFALGQDGVDAALRALTAEGLKLQGALTLAADGTLSASGWTLAGGHLTASGEAQLARGVLAASGKLAIPRLADAGIPGLGGATALELRTSGQPPKLEGRAKLTLTDLTVDGRKLGRSELEATASGLQAVLKLRTLVGVSGIEPLTVAATLSGSADGKRFGVSDLAIVQGANRAGGSGQAALENGALTGLSGRLDGQLPALETLSPLLGQPVRGRGRFELELNRQNGRPTLRAALEAAQLRADASDFALGDLDLKATASAAGFAEIAAGRLNGALTLKAQKIKLADLALPALEAGFTGSSDQASFQATAPGLDLVGSLAYGNGVLKVGVSKFASRLGGVAVSLGQPTSFELAPGRLAVSGLRLDGSDFHLGADGRLGPDGLKGKLELERVPLELAHLLDAGVPAGGRVGGAVSLAGSAAEPRADISLTFAEVGQAQADAAGFSVGGFDGTLSGRWAGGRLSLEGSAATLHGAASLRFAGETPLALRLRPLGLYAPQGGALKGSVSGSADLAAVNDLLATSGDRAAGRVAVDVSISGTPAAPQLGGTLTVSDGHYENQALGTVIDHISARLAGSGRAFAIESFSGTTAGGGTLSVTGTVKPAAEQMFDIRVKAAEARLVQLDDATVDADVDLTLTGGLREARLAGSLDIRRADIRLPDQLPAEVVDLQVTESARSAKRRPGGEAKATAQMPPGRLLLAVSVSARNQVHIRGRGLDTELSCALTIGGTVGAPDPRGALTLQRGKLEVLGKEFQFKRGTITFPGGAGASPELDALAEAKATNFTAQAELTGTVRAPKLVLTSSPEAPQDEVLSRLLFNKSVSQLGALEAVQLADSAAQLMGIGGSTGLVDRIRRSLGVDRLGVTSTGAANPLNPANKTTSGKKSGLGSALEAGRYISRDVYLGVQQGLTSDSSRAKVEVGITDNIQAEVGVGVRVDPEVGLKLQWDY